MAEFPYTTVPGKIKALLGKVREVGVPPKVTAQWSGGKQVIGKTVSTFKAIAEQAEFSPVDEQTELHISSGPLHTPAAKSGAATSVRAGGGPTLHIDIQIHISPEASAEQIDQVFASMAKHIYGGRKTD